ncbi:MAG: SAM-dependent methyltransferase [Kineosporiaceae bacterium]
MDASGWDRRYAEHDLVWGLGPNRYVERELADAPPGTALDVACGEGRNAIWLARQGWHATGIDFSAVGIERACRLAAEAGVADRCTFEVTDVVHDAWPPGPFDAVVLAYLQLPAGERRTALRRAASVLAPGGVLLVVAHDSTNLTDGVGGPQDPAVLYTADDVVADVVGLGLTVERAGPILRPVEGADRPAIDALVRLRWEGRAQGVPHPKG